MIRLILLLAALVLGGIFYLAGGRRKKRLVTRPVVRFTYFCYGDKSFKEYIDSLY